MLSPLKCGLQYPAKSQRVVVLARFSPDSIAVGSASNSNGPNREQLWSFVAACFINVPDAKGWRLSKQHLDFDE
jgi:hypothetical protein